jgi:pimeloyl-ACP methyl ester carboxylesterase
MAEPRTTMTFDVDGLTIAARAAGPMTSNKPLIAALHGGTYTGHYFDVAGSTHGSLLDIAAASGYPVVAFDRPGYGGSSALAPTENTFDRHAELLAIATAQAVARSGATSVLLLGHSIGGMIALMIATRDTGLPLIGVATAGMGAVIRRGGAADGMATLPIDETVDLPYPMRDQIMFGPEFTYSKEGVEQAHTSYAPVPVRELFQAPQWADDHLPSLAPKLRVPLHNALAEYDALWDSTAENVARFAAMFTAAPFVEAGIARNTGHSIDHHTLGCALHLRQIAFAEECAVWDRQNR